MIPNVNTGSATSQKQKILLHMREGNRITQLEAARKFGCYRLGARIAEIKKMLEGTDEVVASEWETAPKSGKSFKAYYIKKLA